MASTSSRRPITADSAGGGGVVRGTARAGSGGGRVVGNQLRGDGRGRGGLGELLPEDRLGEGPQLRRRVDAQLVGQPAAQPVVQRERVRLPPAPIERDHEQPVQPLAQRVQGRQPLEVGDRLAVPAQLEQELESIFDRRYPHLLQARALGLDPLAVADVAQGWSPPEGKRFVHDGQSVPGSPVRDQPAGAGQEVLEPVDVDGVRLDGQQVARRAGEEDVARDAGRDEGPAQFRHPDLEGVGGVGGQVLAPERVGEGVDGDDPSWVEREPGEQGTHGRLQRDRWPAGQPNLDGPQQAEHHSFHARPRIRARARVPFRTALDVTRPLRLAETPPGTASRPVTRGAVRPGAPRARPNREAPARSVTDRVGVGQLREVKLKGMPAVVDRPPWPSHSPGVRCALP